MYGFINKATTKKSMALSVIVVTLGRGLELAEK